MRVKRCPKAVLDIQKNLNQQVIELYHSGQSVLNLNREHGIATVTTCKLIKQFSTLMISNNEEAIKSVPLKRQ